MTRDSTKESEPALNSAVTALSFVTRAAPSVRCVRSVLIGNRETERARAQRRGFVEHRKLVLVVQVERWMTVQNVVHEQGCVEFVESRTRSQREHIRRRFGYQSGIEERCSRVTFRRGSGFGAL